ncbi:MAG: hypothetical protein IJU51_02895 [Clostridia bacterium]|nr:hypothetical protein [Clostridia bacterium]
MNRNRLFKALLCAMPVTVITAASVGCGNSGNSTNSSTPGNSSAGTVSADSSATA